MQKIALPQAITSLIATDENGSKRIVNFTSAMPYIRAVVQYLQDTRQNLSTADLVDFLFTPLELTTAGDELASSLFCALTANFLDPVTDYAVVYRVITDWLLEQRFDTATYNRYLCILNADYPMQSTLNPKKIAVWRNTSKMGNWDKRQAVSVRKWIGSTLVGLTDEQAEDLAKTIDKHLQGDLLDKLDVRFAPSSAFTMWRDAYEGGKISSCMHPLSSCEVGRERTYRSYCTAHYGLPDNGLQLAILYQDGTPVARAITFTDDGNKCFVSSYGDDRLHKWLKANGYNQADGYPDGTILWAGEQYMKPYLDGDNTEADYLYDDEANTYYWRLCKSGGEYELQNTDAYADEHEECELCQDRFPADGMHCVESAVNGYGYLVCECCHENNIWQVYTGGRYTDSVFFHDGMQPDTNSEYVEYDGDYYHVDSLSEYDLKEIDGKVYHNDDLYYCEITDERFTSCDDVYTDADEISTTQPVYFPYDCVSKEYWNENVVECACGTLALERDVHQVSTSQTGDICVLEAHYYYETKYNKAGQFIVTYRLHLDVIERHCDDLDDSDKAEQYLQLCQAYERIQALIAQELGI